ncbi:hypothetical protein ACE1SV_62520 [Streptomyces sennicomposti]
MLLELFQGGDGYGHRLAVVPRGDHLLVEGVVPAQRPYGTGLAGLAADCGIDVGGCPCLPLGSIRDQRDQGANPPTGDTAGGSPWFVSRMSTAVVESHVARCRGRVARRSVQPARHRGDFGLRVPPSHRAMTDFFARWRAEEMVLPDDLQVMPRTGEDGHTDWLHRWEQHLTSLR